MKRIGYIIPDQSVEKELLEALGRQFSLQETGVSTSKKLYLDTFDWLLFKKGLTCCKENQTCRLMNLSTGILVAETPWPSRKNPGFWHHFSESKFQDVLKKIISVRRVLPRFQTETKIRCLNVFNSDSKMVLRIFREVISIPAKKKAQPIILAFFEPVRGYHKYTQQGLQIIKEFDLRQATESLFFMAADAAGQSPGSYTSKLKVTLQPDMSAGHAIDLIFQNQLRVIRQNEEGVIKDLDSEFLHDFRVAVRRSRSCLGQIKNMFTPEATARFKVEIAKLGGKTNRLRDLDVYLLKQDSYQDKVPVIFKEDLAPLFKYLRAERKKEVVKVRRFLKSDEYRTILLEWEKFLAEFMLSSKSAGNNAEISVLALAKKYIFKAFTKVQKQGQSITKDTPDSKIHQLRISCKKLRYLLEFFASLFPPKDIGILVKQLKILQDSLGDFNDLCVQQAALHEYLEQHVQKSDAFIETAAAIGALIAHLNLDQARIRKQFHPSFKSFNSSENVSYFHRLFL